MTRQKCASSTTGRKYSEISYLLMNALRLSPRQIFTVVTSIALSLALCRTTAFAASTGVVVEAESGTLANAMFVYQSRTASGGAFIQTASGSYLTDPLTLVTPDATYTFDVATADNYKLYVRVYAPSDAANSYYYRWDGRSYVNQYTTTGTTWMWQETSATALTAGPHTLNISHRETGFFIDLLVVAKNLTTAEKDAIDARIGDSGGLINPSTAASFNTVNGSSMLEAEQTTFDVSLWASTADAAASNSAVLTARVDQSTLPNQALAGAEFNVTPDQAGRYDIWLRYSATTNQNKVYLSIAGANYGFSPLRCGPE